MTDAPDIPKIDVAPVEPGQDAALYLNTLTDAKVMDSYMRFYAVAANLPPVDPELVELIRIRNGVAQSCKYCLSVRLEGGYDFGRDMEHTVTHFEDSDLSDRQKAALRLATAFLEMPSELTEQAREEALRYFSPQEIVGLMFRLTSFLINKPRAALGIDRALDADRLTPVVSGSSMKKFLRDP